MLYMRLRDAFLLSCLLVLSLLKPKDVEIFLNQCNIHPK